MLRSCALYAGLAQQEPEDLWGIMSRLRRLAETNDTVCCLGQFDNENVCGLTSSISSL